VRGRPPNNLQSRDGAYVEIEFDRELSEVVLSARSPDVNFVLTLPLDGAATFAAAAQQVCDDNKFRSHRNRFIIARARLEVSK